MHNLPFRRSLVMMAALAPLAACGPEEQRDAAPPTAAEETSASATVTAVVQPEQLTLTPLGAGNQPVGPAQELTVQPVVEGERLDLRPVTQ